MIVDIDCPMCSKGPVHELMDGDGTYYTCEQCLHEWRLSVKSTPIGHVDLENDIGKVSMISLYYSFLNTKKDMPKEFIDKIEILFKEFLK